MARFARKLQYGAHDGDGYGFFFALIELAKKKGGRPTGFVLYRRIVGYNFISDQLRNQAEMIRLDAGTAEEAVRRFWPSDTKGMGSEFPGHKSNRWERTTLWLDSVAAGGAYERFGYKYDHEGIRPGRWAKVGMPALRAERRKRRKKKPLQIGNLAHILLKYKARLPELSIERSSVQLELDSIMSCDEYGHIYVAEDDNEKHALLLETIAEIDERIAFVIADIDRTKNEMRYIVRKMFPQPMGMTPKRILRYERERKDMKLSGW